MKKLLLLGVIAALIGTVGCKGQPGYVGSFGIELSAKQKEDLEKGKEAAKAFIAAMPAADRAKAEKEMNDAMGAMDKMAIVINADGTWKLSGMPDGKEVSGTYTAEANNLALTATKGAENDKIPGKFVYNETDQTLKPAPGEKGEEITFKKK